LFVTFFNYTFGDIKEPHIMDITQTNRGFDIASFTDQYGEKCSLQKSSAACYDAIWFGIDRPSVTVFQEGNMGKYVKTSLPPNFQFGGRMHLTREMVAYLLPALTNFARTGSLTEETEPITGNAADGAIDCAIDAISSYIDPESEFDEHSEGFQDGIKRSLMELQIIKKLLPCTK